MVIREIMAQIVNVTIDCRQRRGVLTASELKFSRPSTYV